MKQKKTVLKLGFFIDGEVSLRFKGLSFKAVGGNVPCLDLIKSDAGGFALEVPSYHINGRSCQVEVDKLAEALAYIHDHLPFDEIKFLSKYKEATPEDLMQKILKLNHHETN